MKKNLSPLVCMLLLVIFSLGWVSASQAAPDATTYYVSSSGGDDENDGKAENRPFETIAKVNSLALQPGDRVLFKCGDTWRGEMLIATHSGTAGQPITFGSYPANCANKPIISGAQPISGWTSDGGNVYKAQLNAGANDGKFVGGINQLFRGDERLIMGRWPNIGTADGGYSTIDNAGGNTLTDNELPGGSWSGAVIHMKSIRWAILNRRVTGSAGTTLTLEHSIDCWGGCAGWGYFINNHRNTLDQDGEWYFDGASQTVYLYSASGAPANGAIEGSVITVQPDEWNPNRMWRAWGGITIGEDLTGDGIFYITVENFHVQRWYQDGIAIPTNFHNVEPHHIVIQNNTIRDVDSVGIHLATWVYTDGEGVPDSDNRPAGWRGGHHMTVSGNLIERANRMGIDLYSRESTFSNNTIRDVAIVKNLGARGMGCAYDTGGASGGQCTEDGDGIRIKIDRPADSGNNNTFTANRLERIGYSGFDVFGFRNTFTNNVIIQACISKGDCGGVRTFGNHDIDNTPVYDLTFDGNIIVDTIGNTDGCAADFDALFGFGLYFDMYSRNVTVANNTVIGSTASGVLFQNSTGTMTNNTLYNNSNNDDYGASQLYIGSSPASVGSSSGNIFFTLQPRASTMAMNDVGRLGTSNHNDFFHPYRARHIVASGEYSLAAWRTASGGKDADSQEHWYTQPAGEEPKSVIFYNDTAQNKTFDLGNVLYKDLDQNPVSGSSITLAPYTSRILIDTGIAADLVVSMVLIGSDETLPGAPVTYTITIENQGILDASSVTLVNTIPAQIVNTDWEASPGTVTLQSGTRYTWQIASLPVGATYTFTVSGEYAETMPAGTPLHITASASTTSPEANPTNNHASLFVGNWNWTYLPLIIR
ncbi:MAG: hypothetical protein ACOYYS_13505 [Chloroflexota bacterium]